MRPVLLGSCLGLLLGLTASSVHADDWRPARSVTPAPVYRAAPAPLPAIEPQPVAPARSVGLGKPVGSRSAAPSTSGAVVQTSYESPRLVAPRSKTVVRAQSSDGVAATGFVGSDEQYNCGVVTEGQGGGGFCCPSQGGWLETLFGGAITFESDHCYDRFISPVSNPFFFEDPRALTELRPIFMYQKTPGANPLFRGGDIEFGGLQARLALNERWSLVLHKLGYVAIQPDQIGPGSVGDTGGLSEIQFGPKFSFGNPSTQTIAAIGINFEIATGAQRAFQGQGDGAITPYFSVGQEIGDFHVMGAAGYRFRIDDERSNSFFLSLHLDYSIFDRIYPLVELNWYHYTRNGSVRAQDFEGRDLFNFGSTNVAGKDVVTLATGVRFKITPNIHAGVVYEFPITSREELLDYRITADIIFRY